MKSQHPLRKQYKEAKKVLSSDLSWGPSRQFNILALWGIRLSMVRHWPGFKALIKRIEKDLQNWDHHLHEAEVASMFFLAGCEGEFVKPSTQGGPDLKMDYKGSKVLVECRRSRALTQLEQRNWNTWAPISSEVVHYLNKHTSSAMVRFYPTRDALPGDSGLLLDGVKQKVLSWQDYQARNPSSRWGQGDFQASDGSFRGLLFVADDPDKVFDIATEKQNGIDIPHETEASSLVLDLTLSNLPICDGLWYAKIHTKREWAKVEQRILGHLEEKTIQLNKYRQLNPTSASYPAIVWIDHPASVEATGDELNHLCQIIAQSFEDNGENHFAVVASVVFTSSRLLLSKHGELIPQFRLNFIANHRARPAIYDGFPWMTWSWLDTVKISGTPVRDVVGKRMWLGIK